MLRLSIVKTVFLKELREMLRDRRSLAVMFGVPLVLYPLLTIALATLGKAKVDNLKETRYKITLVNRAAAPELTKRLLVDTSGLEVFESGNPMRGLLAGEIDGLVQLPDDFERDLIAGKNPAIVLRFDRSRTEADFVERKLNHILADYQEWVIAKRLEKYGAPVGVTRSIERKTEDVATAGQRMGNRLAQLLPLLVLVTGMLGALFPALAATTTERELGTLETLLVTPAGRTELLLAKGLLVLLCGLVTAALNMISMSLVLWRTFSLVAPGETLSLSVGTLALTFLAATPALIFFTTLVLIVGLLARTFREANSYATPAMLLPLASLALSIADVKTTPGLLITPIANTTLVMRDVLRGKWSGGAFALAFASSLVYAGLLLSIAARLFSNEQLVNPGWEPLSLKGLGRRGDRRQARLPAVDEAIALFALCMLLMFYVQPSLLKWGLYVMLAVSQIALFFAPAVLFALLGKWKWRETFKLYAPSAAAIVGGSLLGLGLVPVVGLLSGVQRHFWPADSETEKFMNDLLVPLLQTHPVFTALFIGAFAGIFEELLFRGPIQTALMRRNRPWAAIVITAAIFAAAHLDLHGFALRALLGIVLGWIVWRSGSIFPAMLLHGLYDAGTVGLAAWEVHHQTSEAAQPILDGAGAVRLIIGLLLCFAGFWLINRLRPREPGRGFEVIPSSSEPPAASVHRV
ncbi:MAG: putative transporter permease protein [Phycisphaerales bacterium]|nr:putative transporter permease protein [Phycisphaerales bacterium]